MGQDTNVRQVVGVGGVAHNRQWDQAVGTYVLPGQFPAHPPVASQRELAGAAEESLVGLAQQHIETVGEAIGINTKGIKRCQSCVTGIGKSVFPLRCGLAWDRVSRVSR